MHIDDMKISIAQYTKNVCAQFITDEYQPLQHSCEQSCTIIIQIHHSSLHVKYLENVIIIFL